MAQFDLMRVVSGQAPPLGFLTQGLELGLGEQVPTLIVGAGVPDGDAEPCLGANRGTLYQRVDGTDDLSTFLYVKVDEGNDDADWAPVPLAANSAGLVSGSGSSSVKTSTATADKSFLLYYLETTATSGDSRGLTVRMWFNGAGVSGEAARIVASAQKQVAVGGTVNGIHATLSVISGGSISGAGNAIRATLEVATGVTPGGTLAALQLDSNVASGVTLPGTHSFARVSDSGATRLTNLLQMPNAANGTIFAAHVTQVMSHSIMIISDDGTAYYIMCTNTATNRS